LSGSINVEAADSVEPDEDRGDKKKVTAKARTARA